MKVRRGPCLGNTWQYVETASRRKWPNMVEFAANFLWQVSLFYQGTQVFEVRVLIKATIGIENSHWILPNLQHFVTFTIRWISNDYPMTIQWLSVDYPMAIQWLSVDYPMAIQWLSNDWITNFWSIFLDDHWSKKIYRSKMIVKVWCYIHT